jgi:hypothetical protein
MAEPDPYGLPRFPDEDHLPGWTDHSDIAMRTVRVLTRGPVTAVIISHPGVWDVIVADGEGAVQLLTRYPAEIAGTLRAIPDRR